MFLNCNEEIKRQKEQTIRNPIVLISRICCRGRIRNRDGATSSSSVEPLQEQARESLA